jgi:hypothetical protein
MIAVVCLAGSTCAWAQPASVDDAAAPAPVPEWIAAAPAPPPRPFNEERIAGLIPDYQTVRDSHGPIAPLTARQKWSLAWRESQDPFNIASAALAAGFSQMDNQTPKYGEGAAAYSKRVGAALADFGTQNAFSAGLFATVLHQDPRYFRMGPESGVVRRLAYSVSRLGVARQDSGKLAFNASNVFGMLLGIAVSNAYYPAASRTGTVMVGRLGTSLMGGAMGNLMSEFWPDIQQKLFRKKK